MEGTNRLHSPQVFSEILYERMRSINAGIERLQLYEFRYALENLYPPDGWNSIELDKPEEMEKMIREREFYEAIQLKPREKDRIVLDHNIVRLTRMLFAGLVGNEYNHAWVSRGDEYIVTDGANFNPNVELRGSWTQLEKVR